MLLTQACRRQKADGPREHGGFITQDVPEHVGGQDNVETRWTINEPHGAVIHVDVLELDFRIRLGHARHYFAPKTGRLEDIRLVHRSDLAPPQPRKLEGPVRHTFHFVLSINLRIDSHSFAVLGEDSPWIAKVDSPRQLADDHHVSAPNTLGFERRDSYQRIQHPSRAQVHVKPQPLPELQQTLLRPDFRPNGIPSGPPHRP